MDEEIDDTSQLKALLEANIELNKNTELIELITLKDKILEKLKEEH